MLLLVLLLTVVPDLALGDEVITCHKCNGGTCNQESVICKSGQGVICECDNNKGYFETKERCEGNCPKDQICHQCNPNKECVAGVFQCPFGQTCDCASISSGTHPFNTRTACTRSDECVKTIKCHKCSKGECNEVEQRCGGAFVCTCDENLGYFEDRNKCVNNCPSPVDCYGCDLVTETCSIDTIDCPFGETCPCVDNELPFVHAKESDCLEICKMPTEPPTKKGGHEKVFHIQIRPEGCAHLIDANCTLYTDCCKDECIKHGATNVEVRCEHYGAFSRLSVGCICLKPGPVAPEPLLCDMCPVGKPGYPGDPGPQGEDGEVGDDGHKGLPGPPGKKGPGGDPGSDGGEGPDGPPGKRGSDGEDGFDGVDGGSGPVGPPGGKGKVGGPGNKGPKGQIGDLGGEGPEGPPGPDGVGGPNGVKGMMGDPGPKGEFGPPGSPGRPGEPGTSGDNGTPGEKGPIGPPGDEGDPGMPGVPGTKGKHGPTGPVGNPGDPGADSSVPGPPGVQGPHGPIGPKGPAGLNNTSDGVPGPQGPPGPKGRPGKDYDPYAH